MFHQCLGYKGLKHGWKHIRICAGEKWRTLGWTLNVSLLSRWEGRVHRDGLKCYFLFLHLKTSKILTCSSYALFVYFKREKVLSFPFLAKPNRSMVNREFNFTLWKIKPPASGDSKSPLLSLSLREKLQYHVYVTQDHNAFSRGVRGCTVLRNIAQWILQATLIKKKVKLSSYIYRKFRLEQLQSYMMKGFLIYEEMRKYFPIYEEALQLLHSEFPYIWGKFDFLFYQCMQLVTQLSLHLM